MDGWVGSFFSFSVYIFIVIPRLGLTRVEDGWTGALLGLLDGLWSIRLTLHFTHTHSVLQPQWWAVLLGCSGGVGSFWHLPMGAWLLRLPLFAFAAVAFTEYTIWLRPLLHLELGLFDGRG
jgi:hypothetical protein